MEPTAWHPKHPIVSTNSLPCAALPLGFTAGRTLGFDFDHRNSVMAWISAALRLSQSTPPTLPELLELFQKRGMRASDLKSFGFASHFWTQSLVNLPETVAKSGPTLRTPS